MKHEGTEPRGVSPGLRPTVPSEYCPLVTKHMHCAMKLNCQAKGRRRGAV